MSTTAERTRVAFGVYEADLNSGELWKAGRRIRLQSQPFKILATLLERPGEIIARQELQARLWGEDTVVGFEHSLGTAVNRIREALGDSASNPRFIETINRRGYRFIAPVVDLSTPPLPPASLADAFITGESPIEAVGLELSAVGPSPEPARPLRLHWTALIIALLFLSTVYLAVRLRVSATPAPPMRISRVSETGDIFPGGLSVENLPSAVTDGVEIFTRVIQNGQAVPARVSINSGDIQTLAIPRDIAAPSIADISPDRSELLIKSRLASDSEQPLWVVPVHGGSAFRLANVLAHDATWMPDGQGVLYANGNRLFVTRLQDGSSSLFATVPAGRPFWLRWSPDGKTLRFTIMDPISHGSSLWQISTADHRPVPLLTGWSPHPNECCGTWTADGRVFVFQVTRGGATDLWTLSGSSVSDPARLTNGPLSYRAPVADHTGHRIFFLGVDPGTELYRYDAPSGGFIPAPSFLSHATHLDFSRDRQWIAWTDSHGRLWRSRVNGSERLQLTPDFLKVFLATWSPDGSRLAVMARQTNKPWQIYTISADGGNPEPLFQDSRNACDPSWSPDGTHLVFGRLDNNMGRENEPRMLHVIDLSSGRNEVIPHSEGLFSPRWSPDGRYIAAITLDQQKLMLYDVKGQRWTTLASTSASDPVWSADSRAIYFHALTEEFKPLYRATIASGRLEQVATLQSFHPEKPEDFSFSGLGPDDAPFVRISVHSTDLYTATLDAR